MVKFVALSFVLLTVSAQAEDQASACRPGLDLISQADSPAQQATQQQAFTITVDGVRLPQIDPQPAASLQSLCPATS